MREYVEIIEDMRRRAGSRQKLANVADVSISAAQSWEKKGAIPEGRPLARLVTAYPDLGGELIEILSAAEAADEWAERPGPD